MSQSAYGLQISHPAGEDLSSGQYCVVALSSGEVVRCGTTDVPLGVLQNAPESGEAASVRITGTSKVKADGAFSENDELMVNDANAEVDTATAPAGYWEETSGWVVGIALEAATDAGDIVEMELRKYRRGV